jgi:simple sugar transport system ATP-binding protein
VLRLAEEGMSVTFISSEIDEIVRTCSRIVVMKDRNVAGRLTGKEITQFNIMRTIAGAEGIVNE